MSHYLGVFCLCVCVWCLCVYRVCVCVCVRLCLYLCLCVCVCMCFFAVCLCRSLKFCVYLCLLLLKIWHSISISFLLIICIIFNEAFTYNVFDTTYNGVTCSSTLSGHPSSSFEIYIVFSGWSWLPVSLQQHHQGCSTRSGSAESKMYVGFLPPSLYVRAKPNPTILLNGFMKDGNMLRNWWRCWGRVAWQPEPAMAQNGLRIYLLLTYRVP